MEIHPARLSVPPAECADKEIPELVFFLPHHLKRRIKEFRQDNKIHRNVILSRGQDLLDCVLVQEEQVPLL